jgi:[protein-PII] uridylyltransferase
VVDSFYVTDLTGAKITNVDRKQAIEETLLAALKGQTAKSQPA